MKKYSQMKLQVKRKALDKLNRLAVSNDKIRREDLIEDLAREEHWQAKSNFVGDNGV